jgi:hypothetical protein
MACSSHLQVAPTQVLEADEGARLARVGGDGHRVEDGLGAVLRAMRWMVRWGEMR